MSIPTHVRRPLRAHARLLRAAFILMETLFIFPANHGKKLPALAGAPAFGSLDKAVSRAPRQSKRHSSCSLDYFSDSFDHLKGAKNSLVLLGVLRLRHPPTISLNPEKGPWYLPHGPFVFQSNESGARERPIDSRGLGRNIGILQPCASIEQHHPVFRTEESNAQQVFVCDR